jgi:hypothetical protein
MDVLEKVKVPVVPRHILRFVVETELRIDRRRLVRTECLRVVDPPPSMRPKHKSALGPSPDM